MFTIPSFGLTKSATSVWYNVSAIKDRKGEVV